MKSTELIDSDNKEFEVIEFLCASKTRKQDECEDYLVVNNNYIAVIDGATSKNSNSYNGKKGGKIAAELIANCLQNKNFDAHSGQKFLIDYIQSELKAYAKANQLEKRGIHLCASAVVYNAAKRQILTVGDCQFLIDGKHYTFHNKVDTVLSEARSLAIHMLIQSGKTEEDLLVNDISRELIIEELKMQRWLENTDDEYGYSIFSNQGSVNDYTVTDVPPGSEVILASDGYPELFESLKESEDRLNEIIRLDPLCYKIYKSTKGLKKGNTHFDDRTYIRFRTKM